MAFSFWSARESVFQWWCLCFLALSAAASSRVSTSSKKLSLLLLLIKVRSSNFFDVGASWRRDGDVSWRRLALWWAPCDSPFIWSRGVLCRRFGDFSGLLRSSLRLVGDSPRGNLLPTNPPPNVAVEHVSDDEKFSNDVPRLGSSLLLWWSTGSQGDAARVSPGWRDRLLNQRVTVSVTSVSLCTLLQAHCCIQKKFCSVMGTWPWLWLDGGGSSGLGRGQEARRG